MPVVAVAEVDMVEHQGVLAAAALVGMLLLEPQEPPTLVAVAVAVKMVSVLDMVAVVLVDILKK